MKLINNIKKNYLYINMAFLGLTIYIIIYPFLSLILEKVSPILTKCTYLYLTGNPCPFCGGTRFIRNISKVFTDINYIFNFFGVFFLIIILELIFRLFNIIRIKRNKMNDKIIIFDIIIHIILIILLIVYEIIFFIN